VFDLSRHRYRFRIVIPAYPAFNIYSHIAVKTTALGPVCVASTANKMAKWDVEVIDENNLGKFGPVSKSGGADHEFLQQQRPADVVGFYGGLTSTIPRLYQLAQFYKNKGIITIAGGQHFVEDNTSDALSSGIDYIVFGEAEETITELLDAIQNGRDAGDIKGIAFLRNGKIVFTEKREQLTDFSKLPLPDFSLVRYAKMKIYPVERIRGCGMDCEFCTVKGKPRHAEPERLLEHISSLVETRNAKHFFIVDDLFGQQRDETIRLCNLIADYEKRIGRRLDITVQIRLDKARDAELLSAMQRAGVQTVAIGFESPIDAELKAMNKHMSSSEMVSWARIFHKFGFLVHGMFIFGYPLKENTGLEISVEERVKFYKDFISKALIDTVQVMLPVPLPGTELRYRLMQQKRIYPLEDIGWEYYDGNFPLFEPDEPMTSEQMHTCSKKIMGRLYRFKYMFLIAANTFLFPAIIFFLHNIQLGWQKWYRPWRNSLIRFGGWIILKKWTMAFRRNKFLQKLQTARQHLVQAR
jgi:anaerobic magnesium-protoporphyrin IX monomethyl ester cyclase